MLNFIQDIECADLISTRYFSEIDEALISFLNSFPSSATRAFSVLYLSHALDIDHSLVESMRFTFAEYIRFIPPLDEIIFCFSCSDIQRETLFSFTYRLLFDSRSEPGTPLFDFFSNPQRSQRHRVDHKMHCSITERCFSYVLNHRLAYFPGIHCWAKKIYTETLATEAAESQRCINRCQ